MKVLFIQPTGDKRGHYGSWTSKLCEAMAKQAIDLTLVTNKIDAEAYLGSKPSFRIIEVGQGEYDFTTYDKAMENGSKRYWHGYFRNSFVIVRYALALCKKEKFDAIFLTDAEYLTATILLKYFSKSLPPIIWHVQAANFSYDTYAGSVWKKLYKVCQRQIFKSVLGREVKGFAVLGEFHKHTLRKQLGLNEKFLIELIPDGADVLIERMDQDVARKNIGLDYSGQVFLFLGMLRKDKGIEYLIEAISQAKEHDFKIIIAGAPFEWSAADVNSLISQYDVKSKVYLCLGYVPDQQISSYYFACDTVVFPYTTQYTGSCGPLTKGAGSHRKPVIVTDVSDIGRMVRHYRNGLVVQPNNASSLCEGLVSMMNKKMNEKDVMMRGADELARHHSWDGVAKALLSLLMKANVAERSDRMY